jgi:hypothetical protein
MGIFMTIGLAAVVDTSEDETKYREVEKLGFQLFKVSARHGRIAVLVLRDSVQAAECVGATGGHLILNSWKCSTEHFEAFESLQRLFSIDLSCFVLACRWTTYPGDIPTYYRNGLTDVVAPWFEWTKSSYLLTNTTKTLNK